MVIKVKDHPYFFVIITRLLKDNLKCLVNNQPKTEDKIYSVLRFGWVEVSRVHKVHLRRGRRIPVNALSAGRRCKSASRGKVGVLLFIQGTQFLAVQYPTASKLLERSYALSKTVYSKEHKMVESGSLKFV